MFFRRSCVVFLVLPSEQHAKKRLVATKKSLLNGENSFPPQRKCCGGNLFFLTRNAPCFLGYTWRRWLYEQRKIKYNKRYRNLSEVSYYDGNVIET